ncbi:hypothetical protein Mtc_1672 [Methanocella conradii HZ254]|uniref:Uncharacterized protein n=1 Tax=Methanocella conradii (strain DSM 24694 / JCM 17849 / CGMCC 1.5162 / HZ254) TaxID=1041930 RepID=H8I8U9_METCZ|nr:hypothetical protein [Methanocella conradii]AFD00420.1 hypothetical protein Mtc_1672 [Methanocella conradii HZ254]
MLESHDVWTIFSETIRNMNDTANSQYLETLNEVNATQAHSIDPSDAGAYNLTMYGLQCIHDIQSRVVSPMSHLRTLAENATKGNMAFTGPFTSPIPIETTQATDPKSSLITTAAMSMPFHDVLAALIFILLVIAAYTILFYRK